MISGFALVVCAVLAASPGLPGDVGERGLSGAQPQLSLTLDATIVTTGLGLIGGASLYERAHPPSFGPLNASAVPAIDRIALGRGSPLQDRASTVLQDALIVGGPLALALAAWDGRLASLQAALVSAESILVATSAARVAKAVIQRPRPYAYAGGPQSTVAYESFFSGHTAVSFAAATSAALLLDRLYPRSPWVKWAAIAGLTTAAAVGTLRVTSGQHFPTDVAAGALAGVAAGLGVPALHRWGPRLQLSAGPSGLALSGSF